MHKIVEELCLEKQKQTVLKIKISINLLFIIISLTGDFLMRWTAEILAQNIKGPNPARETFYFHPVKSLENVEVFASFVPLYLGTLLVDEFRVRNNIYE